MRIQILLAVIVVLLTACDPERATRPIQVVATPELVHRQSCQALIDAERTPQDEIVLVGTAEHGNPDVLRVTCDSKERSVSFALVAQSDDLGMKELRKQWIKKTSAKSADCSSCPKYNVSARFVGELRADPKDPSHLIYRVRTADSIHRKRIHYGEKRDR